MNNKMKRKGNRNQKCQRNQNGLIPNQNREPKFYTKVKLSIYKIDLSETSQEEFIYRATEYYYNELIYKKYFEIGELFSLNKNSSYKEITKINNLLDELNINEKGSPRIIFFQSPPMIGMSYIIKYFNNNNFKFFLWNNSYGNDNKRKYIKYLEKYDINSNEYKDGSILMQYQEMKEFIEENIITNKNDNNTIFIVLKNLPYDLFIMSLKENKYTSNFIKNWKSTILLFYELINNILNKSEYSNIKLIFFTDDKEIDEFELKTIFPNKIIEHPLTKIVICNPIPQRKLHDIIRSFLDILRPSIFEEDEYKNLIESIYLEFGSNIQQIFDFLILEINTRYYLKINKYINNNKANNYIYQTKPLTQKGKYIIQEYKENHNKSNNKINNNNKNSKINNFQIKKEQQLDHDLFRLLGKLLYNKRYVRQKKAILKLKKEEFGDNYETPRYYDINELINDIPISNNSFNDLLIYNTIEHFNDIEEYSSICELFSFTDTIDTLEAFIYDKNNQYFYNNSNIKTYLNCLGVTTFNMSQYNTGKNYKFNSSTSEKGLMTIKKPDIKINKYVNKFDNKDFFKSCEYFPCLISLNIKCFYKEGFYDFYKLNNLPEINIDEKMNLENKRDGLDIHYYLKKKEKKKFLEEEKVQSKINNKKIRNNNNKSSPKNIMMRNIPEEDRIAMENMLNGNDEDDEELSFED